MGFLGFTQYKTDYLTIGGKPYDTGNHHHIRRLVNAEMYVKSKMRISESYTRLVGCDQLGYSVEHSDLSERKKRIYIALIKKYY